MPTAIEHRLDRMVHELNEIKKEIIQQKAQQASYTVERINAWKSLSIKTSASWDGVSVVDEIRSQRDRIR